MLIDGVATWLGSSRPRCVFLLLCSPLLLPLLLAIFPFLCVGALCFKYSGRRWRKSPEELLDVDGLRRCEEGCYRGCGGEEEEAKRQDEECLLHRYLEDQLLLIRFAYECEDGNGNVNGDFQFPEIDDTTIPLLGSPATHWSLIAFGAAYGIASAYTDCSRIFDSSSTKSQLPKISEPIIPQDGQE